MKNAGDNEVQTGHGGFIHGYKSAQIQGCFQKKEMRKKLGTIGFSKVLRTEEETPLI